MLKTPIIIINFKTYKESIGDNAVKLAEICNKIAEEEKVSIAIAPQCTDIYRVSKLVSIPILSQHVNPVDLGRNTGFLPPESVKESGAAGTLLNHSEHRLDFNLLKDSIERAKQAELKTIVCARDVENAEKIAHLNPDFIAVEPPELIGGKISVSDAKPEVISDSVKKIKSINKKIKVLCGAGIHNKDDVKKSIELGADGVLVASGIVKAENQESALRDLANGLK